MEIKLAGRIEAKICAPGSKSYTQRAIIIASLAEGESRLSNILVSEDTTYLMEALSNLGASIRKTENSGAEELLIKGTAGRVAKSSSALHLGNNGTAMRFLTTLTALGEGRYYLSGEPRLCERPVSALIEALQTLGVDAKSEHSNGCPPIIIHANGLEGGKVRLKDIESSQFVSSLLIAAPYARKDLELILEGNTVSAPYIEMTVEVMKRFGAEVVSESGLRYFVRNGKKYKGTYYQIEGDFSSASYFFLAAALCGGRIRVSNLNAYSKQGDRGVLDILVNLGCSILQGDNWMELQGGILRSGDLVIDMGNMPDMVPTVSVMAAFRKGRTRITNAAHLRIKESNRLEAMIHELHKIGASAEETPDGLIVDGGCELHGAEIETYNDHRIAMSFAVAGLVVPGMKIRNKECVSKSFPRFWEELDNIVKVNSEW
jgi:3-phosphoshikimate 1-carboxyvinyltransferase